MPRTPGADIIAAPDPNPSITVRRTLLVLGFLLLTAVAVLQVRPLRLPSNDARGLPAMPLRDTGHAALLLVEPSLFTGSDGPADLKWMDLLRQTFGGCDVRTMADLRRDPEKLLAGRRVTVIGRGTLATLGPDLRDLLQPFVATGLTVLLEGPEGPLAQALGIEAAGIESRERLPWPQDPGLRELGDHYRLPPARGLQVPYRVVSARPAPSAGPRPRPTLSPAGRPLVWTLVEGDGAWILHMLGLSDLSRALHQGRRVDGFSGTAALAATEGLRSADRAWADAWVENLLDPDSAPEPWPRLWPAPAAADGWLIVSQDGGPPDPTADERLTRFAAEGHADGLLARWPMGSEADPLERREIRTGPLRWAVRPAGLATQALAIEPPTRLHRNRNWQWPGGADLGWSQLTGAGFRADASFGPDPGTGGWTTGTTLPFRPLSASGLPHAVWEVSTHWRGTAAELDLNHVARCLRENRDGSHGAIHLALEGSVPRTLIDALADLAAAHGHRFAAMHDLLDFWERRMTASWSWSASPRTLHVEIGPAGEADPMLATAVPRSWGGLPLVAWDATWAGARARRARTYGSHVLVVEHPPGGGALTFTYGGR